jgi:hypothetical protein
VLYLTPERYRAMGFGTEDLEDADLRAMLFRASRQVDAYCTVPLVPSRFSFLGGTVTDEEQAYDVGDGVTSFPQRVIFPRFKPIKAVSSCRIYVTNQQYISFSADEMYVSKSQIQIISFAMTANGLYGAAIIPAVGLMIPMLRLTYTYGWAFLTTDEFLEPTDARTFRAQNQFWDDTAVTVKVDGVTVTTGFTLDRDEGVVLFDDNQSATAIITVSYGYRMPSEVAEATGLIAAANMGEREMVARGMSGVRSLKIGEITIERDAARRGESAKQGLWVPADAGALLEGFRFITLR